MIPPLLAALVLASQAGTRPPAQIEERPVAPPSTVCEIADGTIRDVSTDGDVIWITSGRNLRPLDPVTGELGEPAAPSPFTSSLVALEPLPGSDRLLVATHDHLLARAADGTGPVFDASDLGQIKDVKPIGRTRRVALLVDRELVVVEFQADGARLLGRTGTTDELLDLWRLDVVRAGGRWLAFALGTPKTASRRGMRSLLACDLDAANGFAGPRFLGTGWDPASVFRSPEAQARAVRVLPEGKRLVAWVACGKVGQLCEVDVTSPERPRLVERYELLPDRLMANIEVDAERGRLWVVGGGSVSAFDIARRRPLGQVYAGMVGGGDRDLALWRGPDGRRILWSGVRGSTPTVLSSVDVTAEGPERHVSRWWISSCDGAACVPEWDSVYLPTFGGIARYDISDREHPRPRGFQGAGGLTEHIEIAWPDPDSREHGLLVTPSGDGIVRVWPISREHPDPGPPAEYQHVPKVFGDHGTYQNDATTYRRDGRLFLLSDISDRRVGMVTLRAMDLETGEWVVAAERSEQLRNNAIDITVDGDVAFVTCRGGLLVFALDELPERLSLLSQHVIDVDGRAGPDRTRGFSILPDGRTLFLASDSPASLSSWRYDRRARRLEGPLSVLREGLPGFSGRMHPYAPTSRLYAGARGGNLVEIDVSDPADLRVLSSWNNGAYDGPVVEGTMIELPEGPRLLVAKDNEGFALLDPDDGL